MRPYNKILGGAGVIFGFLLLALFLLTYNNRLLISASNLFVVKYFLIILIVNGCFYFIVFGFLYYFDVLVPYYSYGISKYEKAKNNFVSIILSSPLWLSLSITIHTLSRNLLWIIVSVLIPLLMLYIFILSVKQIKREDRENVEP